MISPRFYFAEAMCLLGLGSENLIKVQTLSDFSVDVKAMKRVLQRLENVQVTGWTMVTMVTMVTW